ncbi:hypothetical protein VTL71DRAFT_3298 [Oculimacula yallundae]|uniref:DUF7730 domain-containing protein n=1 Tax=Oculimacula yallundae TaxID=86028 RepID=A0ABR4C6Q0_9HELO
MPSFLNLPREIRDEIYNYSLVSPSGFIAPYLLSRPSTLKPQRRVKASKRKSTKNNNKQHYLITDPLAFPPHDPALDTADLFLAHKKNSYITLSLTSTCRQIYNETQGLFWKHNTFYFSSINESGHSLGISRTLKLMGQTSSRLIQTMTIIMPGQSTSFTHFRKVLKTLSSRARLGDFRKLEMVWEEETFRELLSTIFDSNMEGFLKDLGELTESERFERVVRVPACPKSLSGKNVDEDGVRDAYEVLVYLIHLTVGGTTFCGGELWVGLPGARNVSADP